MTMAAIVAATPTATVAITVALQSVAANNNHNNHNNRHRVFRNGAWVWIYGPDYYYDNYAYGGDCYWLRQQAYATGSPYWWSRYNACVGYY